MWNLFKQIDFEICTESSFMLTVYVCIYQNPSKQKQWNPGGMPNDTMEYNINQFSFCSTAPFRK